MHESSVNRVNPDQSVSGRLSAFTNVRAGMPVYTFTYNLSISPEQKQRLAAEVTEIHCSNTGAPAKYVQTVFQNVGQNDAYTAGQVNKNFISLEAIIRPGRSQDVESKMLWQLNDMLKLVLRVDRYFISLGRFTTPHLIENGNLLPAA